MKSYAIKEVFYSIQGEGLRAGAPSIFVRFVGCNVWSGREQDRERDASKGGCALFCDTNFLGTDGEHGGNLKAHEILRAASELWPDRNVMPNVVLTGGEPMLQVDEDLILSLQEWGAYVCIETNGSRPVPPVVDWVTLSPKPPLAVIEQRYSEVKVIYPAFDPLPWSGHARNLFVQPQDDPDPAKARQHLAKAVEFVKCHPPWRLSLQTHKMIGLP